MTAPGHQPVQRPLAALVDAALEASQFLELTHLAAKRPDQLEIGRAHV